MERAPLRGLRDGCAPLRRIRITHVILVLEREMGSPRQDPHPALYRGPSDCVLLQSGKWGRQQTCLEGA